MKIKTLSQLESAVAAIKRIQHTLLNPSTTPYAHGVKLYLAMLERCIADHLPLRTTTRFTKSPERLRGWHDAHRTFHDYMIAHVVRKRYRRTSAPTPAPQTDDLTERRWFWLTFDGAGHKSLKHYLIQLSRALRERDPAILFDYHRDTTQSVYDAVRTTYPKLPKLSPLEQRRALVTLGLAASSPYRTKIEERLAAETHEAQAEAEADRDFAE